jgi:hypothetical protein
MGKRGISSLGYLHPDRFHSGDNGLVIAYNLVTHFNRAYIMVCQAWCNTLDTILCYSPLFHLDTFPVERLF